MPTLKKLCELLDWPPCRTTKEFVARVEGLGSPVVNLSEWQEDYSWEAIQQAMADGYVLAELPAGWVQVRDIAQEIGGDSAVPWLLGSGERAAQIVWDSGIYDRCRKHEVTLELVCSPEDADILRDYAKPKWNARKAARGRR